MLELKNRTGEYYMSGQKTEFLGHTKYDQDGHLIATQSLKDHLLNTKNLAEQYGQALCIPHVTGLAALLHDLGKFRPEFQEYIRHEGNHRRGSVDHSSFGAMFIRQYLAQKIKETSDVNEQGPLKEFGDVLENSIFSHHASLGLMDYLTPAGDLKSPYLERIEKFNANGVSSEELIAISKLFYTEVMSEASFNRYVEAAITEFVKIKSSFKENKKYKLYFQNLSFLTDYIYSCLLDADRTDTAAFEFGIKHDDLVNLDRKDLFENYYQKLLSYISSLNKGQVSGINKYRSEISADCDRAAERPSDIYTLSAPTGAGKTLASLRYALKHSYLHHKQHIIYVLPYITIIEQNASVARKVLNGSETNTDNILEFHSNVSNQRQQTSSEKSDVLELAEDSWDEPIIFTTMVQFLNTIYASRTSNRRRFHNLCNSVIIFDEVQKVPTKCLSLFNQALNFLKKVGQSDLVLCTATQPALDKVKSAELDFAESPEIITDLSQKVEQFRRVEIVNEAKQDNGVDMHADGQQIAEMIFEQAQKVKSVLGIFNTIKATTNVYMSLKQLFSQSTDNPALYYLSTDMCPQHRKDKIQEMLGKLAAGERVICISTPLIEAGVDVSFEAVFRSLTGVDSIAQAAGRCNRNDELPVGHVFLVNDKDERLGGLLDIKKGKNITIEKLLPNYQPNQLLEPTVIRYYFEQFYGRNNTLQQYPYPNSSNYEFRLADLVDGILTSVSYYRNKSPLLQSVKQYSSLSTLAKHFQVIENSQVSVIAPYNQRAQELIAELNADLNTTDKLGQLLKQAQPFIVSVYENKFKQLLEDNDIYSLNRIDYSKTGIFAFQPQAYKKLTLEDNTFSSSVF